MNLRNVWRFATRLFSLLAVPDNLAVQRPAGRLVLLTCNDVDRGMQQDGLRFSPLLEGIGRMLDELGYRTVNLTHPYAMFRGSGVKGGALTLNHRAFAMQLASLLSRSRDDHAGPKGTRRTRLEMGLYRRLLLALKPEAVVSIQPPLALCSTARHLGIPVIEAMHGTNIALSDRIFANHMASPDLFLPTHVLCFDDVTHATYQVHCAGRDIRPLRTVDPWMHACQREYGLFRSARPAPCKSVLFTLQWGYDGERDALRHIIPNGILHPAVEQAIALTAGKDVRVLLRLHPVQMNLPGYRHHRRHMESLVSRFPHVEFQRASTAPLPVLLNEVSGHLTMSSSAVGEAAAVHVPSLLLCPTLKPGGAHEGFFSELLQSGMATLGSLNAQAIAGWIEGCSASGRAPCDQAEAERAHQDVLHFYATLLDRARSPAELSDGRHGRLGALACEDGTP
jgi:hypothetical protein